jgi:serine/threonine protein kinase
MLIKIGDFGLSARLNEDIQYGKIGTPSYIAPEILEKRPIRKEELHLIDVYSIGVIFYELLNLFNLTTKH